MKARDKMAAHETFQHSGEAKTSSDRGFGLVFAAVSLLAALSPLRRHQPPRLWALAASVVFLVAALAAPGVLKHLNRAWTWFGLTLQKITTPIFMGALFYGVFTPMGFVLRALGKDLLSTRPDPGSPSYWHKREQGPSATETMRHQF